MNGESEAKKERKHEALLKAIVGLGKIDSELEQLLCDIRGQPISQSEKELFSTEECLKFLLDHGDDHISSHVETCYKLIQEIRVELFG